MVPKKISLAIAVISLLYLGIASPLSAEIRLPSVIGDHMVIQQDKPISIWGWAGRDEKISVKLAGQMKETRAAADGKWKVVLDPLKAGGDPLELVVRGEKSQEIVVRDILIGEVWLGSGQSNMEMALTATFAPIPEILRADHPGIRLFLVPRRTADRPQDDVVAKWQICTPKTAGPFSAVAYYFGLELHHKLKVPVGLIESAWGGTAIEPWTPPAGFASVPELKPILAGQNAKYEDYRNNLKKALPLWDKWVRETQKALDAGAALPPAPGIDQSPANPFANPQAPTTLYNGMIHALTPFAIRGAIWYQGEANRMDGLAYEKKMEALIRGWREVWKVGDFPFYFVGIAPFYYEYNKVIAPSVIPDFNLLPLIWEAQANVLRLPNTGMAVITDITEINDIHPRNKKDVGYRLALWARAQTYGEKDLVPSGPLYKSISVEGDKARIRFDFAGGGLIANDGLPVRWFEIAGDDRVFYRAAAEIAGETVIVRSPSVAAPKAVRFGWNQFAVPNLANRQGLPAAPFRTDTW